MIASLLGLGLLASSSAQALDQPGVYYRQSIGFGGWPTGLMEETRLQYRAPLIRKDGSLMLNDTYAGAGVMVRATPAFTELGPRLSISPVDIFELELQASRLQYYSKTYALMGFDRAKNKLGSQRTERAEAGDGVTGGGWSFTASPTLKLRGGPIILVDTWSIRVSRIDQASPEPYTYDPWTDLVIAWNETTFEHEAATLFTAIDSDDGGGTFWVGAWFRDRFTVVSPDRSITLGPVIITRPGRGRFVPTILGRSMFYLRDVDRVPGIPNLQAALIWSFDGDRQ